LQQSKGSPALSLFSKFIIVLNTYLEIYY